MQPTDPKTRRRDAAALAAVALSAFLLAGCSSAKRPTPTSKVLKGLKGAYVAMGSRTTTTGTEYQELPLDLWGPFRWEVTMGVFDPKRTDGLGPNSRFATEIDFRQALPTFDFFAIIGIWNPQGQTGIGVYAAGTSYVSPATKFYAGATTIDVAMDTDGTTLHFLARKGGTQDAYDEIGSTPLGNQATKGPLLPAIGISGQTPGKVAEIGFDNLRVTSNGTSPTALDPSHAAVKAIFDAMIPTAEARYRLTGDDLDASAARAQLATAVTKIADAVSAVQAMPTTPGKTPPTPQQVAVAKLDSASRKVTKLMGTLDKKGNKAAKPVLNALPKVFLSYVQAGDAILPDDMRDKLVGDAHSLK